MVEKTPHWFRYEELESATFGFGTIAAATGVPMSRLNQWLQTGAVELLEGTNTGRGVARTFRLADAYSIGLIRALTDPETGLGIPVRHAAKIVSNAIFGPTAYDAAETMNRARRRHALEQGDGWLGYVTRRNMQTVPSRDARPLFFLVGGPWVLATDGSVDWHGCFLEVIEFTTHRTRFGERWSDPLPNPTEAQLPRVVLPVTAILNQIDEELVLAAGIKTVDWEE